MNKKPFSFRFYIEFENLENRLHILSSTSEFNLMSDEEKSSTANN